MKILTPIRATFNWVLDSYRRVCDLKPDDTPTQEFCVWVIMIFVVAAIIGLSIFVGIDFYQFVTG